MMIPNHPNIILLQKRVFLLTFILFVGCEVTMKKHIEEDEVYMYHASLSSHTVLCSSNVMICVQSVCGLWCLLNLMLLWPKR